MKQVFIVRHAKSSWADPSLDDIDRPLNKRGKRDGPFMARKLAELVPHVDMILCSPARRARDTCKYFVKEIEVGRVTIDDAIYHAWPERIIERLQSLDEEVRSAMVFGHNPGLTSLYNHFSEEYLDNLPTCGIFELECSGKWSEMDPSNTSAKQLLYPKQFLL